MRLTKEQQQIVDQICLPISEVEEAVSGGRLFSFPAVAGAGKSMLIVEMARRDAQRDMLFLCQSSNIADRARSTLPANVKVKTIAGAAFDYLEQVKPDKAKEKIIKRHDPRSFLAVAPTGTTEIEAMRAESVLSRFYRSPHPHPQEVHLPPEADWSHAPGDYKPVLATARSVWFAQTRKQREGGLPFCFSSLIKWWTLGRTESIYYPELDKHISASPIPGKYDLIVVEEAQLLNTGQLDFLSRQRASVVFFGDGYQALKSGSPRLQHQSHPTYERCETLTLHESFRFGPSVASVCSALAHKGGAGRRDWVKGLGQSAVYSEYRRFEWEAKDQHYTLLTTSTATLFHEALEATRRGKVTAWINGLASHPIDLLRDLIVLGMGRESAYRAETSRHLIKTPWLRNAPSLAAVLERYQTQPSHPISQIGRWVYNMGDPNLLRIVDGWRRADEARQKHYLNNPFQPLARDITLGTVPQAQGHEWPRVALADEVFPMSLCGHEWGVEKSRLLAINIAYTAASRAQRGLAVPAMFLAHLQAHGWELPDDVPNVDLDPLGKEGARSLHPHFGIDRQARLEMTGSVRERVKRPPPSQPASSRDSGQNRIRDRILAGAERAGPGGIDALRAALHKK